MQTFEVHFSYYQYNSGAADNGTYGRIVSCASATEALDFARRIEADASARRDERWNEIDEDLRSDLIPHSGYFLAARAYRVERHQLDAETPPGLDQATES